MKINDDLQRLGAPVLIAFPPALETALSTRVVVERRFKSYDEYLDSMRAVTDDASLETRLERIVSRCVEGETALALEELLSLEFQTQEWVFERRAVYYRLCGTLRWECGATGAAVESFQRALDLALEAGHMFLERDTRWLLHVLTLEFASDSDESFRDIPAFDRVLLRDAAAHDMFVHFSKEGFDLIFDGESSTRWSSSVMEAFADANKAMTVAYLTGDFVGAKDARRTFAQELFRLWSVSKDSNLLPTVVTELARAREADRLERVLRLTGHLVAPIMDLAGLLDTLWPLEDSGRAASGNAITALRFVAEAGVYFSDATRRVLSERFLEATLAFLRGERSVLARTEQFAETYLIKAFSEVVLLEPQRLGEFVAALKPTSVNRAFNFWSVLAAYEWTEEDRASAERLVRLAEAAQRETVFDSNYAYPVIQTLLNVRRTYRELGAEIDALIVADAARHDNPLDSFWYAMIENHSPTADPFVRDWACRLVDTTVAQFNKASESDSVMVNRVFHDIYRVTGLYDHYPKRFPEQSRLEDALRLLKSSRNTSVYVLDKANAFQVVTKIAAGLSDPARAALRRVVKARSPGAERTRTLDRPGWGSSADQARLRLLELRLSLEFKVSHSDLSLVLSALVRVQERETFEAGIEVASMLVQRRSSSADAVLVAMASRLDDENLHVRARVARRLVRLSSFWLERSCADFLRARLEQRFAVEHPFVLQSLLAEVDQNFETIPALLRAAFEVRARSVADHPHRFVRRWAARVLEKFDASQGLSAG
jgi:hypothetical protein